MGRRRLGLFNGFADKGVVAVREVVSALIAIKRRGDGADIQLLLYLGRASYRLWLVSLYRLTENGGRHLLHVALSPTCRPPALSGQWKNVLYFWPWQRDPIPDIILITGTVVTACACVVIDYAIDV